MKKLIRILKALSPLVAASFSMVSVFWKRKNINCVFHTTIHTHENIPSLSLSRVLFYYYYKFEINSKLNKGISYDSCEHHSNEEAELHQQNFNDDCQMDTNSCSVLRKCQVLNVQCWMLNVQCSSWWLNRNRMNNRTSWNNNQNHQSPLNHYHCTTYSSNGIIQRKSELLKIFGIEESQKKIYKQTLNI